MRKLTEEKDLSLRHYDMTLHNQESDIARGKSESEDLKKQILLHDKEQNEIRTRIDHTITRMRETEQEYALVRENTNEVVRSNKVLKAELALVQSALKHELDINEENQLRLETVKRNLAMVTDELIREQAKEE